MPQASDELRALMRDWFNYGLTEHGPSNFLLSHGFSLTEGYQWVLPTPSYTISTDELLCLQFLVDEWDFGGIAPGQTYDPLAKFAEYG